MEIAVSGASGLIGTVLRQQLGDSGHRVLRLVRRPASGADEITWDPPSRTIDAASLEGVDAVVHLAGAGIGAKRWTDTYKQELVASRTIGTSLLATTIANLINPPRVFLSGSAVGFYGSRGDQRLTEKSGAGDSFLADLCVQWEAAVAPATDAGIRTALLRTGIVQTAAGGALAKQLPLFKIGLGGRFGAGTQYQSWISMDDEVGAIIHLLQTEVEGPVNLTAPNPATSAEFAKTLAKVLGRPSFMTVPAFAPRLILGREMADALLFESQRVMPETLEACGYDFVHPTLESCLAAALSRRP